MSSPRQLGNRGMALLLVLVIVTLLTALLMELAFSTLVDMRLTETFRDTTRAHYLARGGIDAGRMLLQQDRNAFDAPQEPWSQGIINYPVGQGTVSVGIQDLDGRLAINQLVRGSNPQALMIDRFYRLFAGLGIDHLADPAELTAALIDWLDPDDEPYPMIMTDGLNIPVSGAEDLFYQSRGGAYSCKNGPLETLEELLLIRGFSRELLDLLRPHLAVNGSSRININTASAAVLESLDETMDAQVVALIEEARQETPISDIDQLEDKLPVESYSLLKSLANQQRLGTTSVFFRIRATALVNDGMRELTADISKQGNLLLFLKVE
jgi:general secretion pathway protein K